MIAPILADASAGQDLDSLLSAVQDHSWVAAAVAGVALVVAVLAKLGVMDKISSMLAPKPAATAPAPAPAKVDPAPQDDAAKAQDLLDGKK
jgi:hypothetical protein